MGLLRRRGKACTRRSTFLVQPREEHRRREVKPLRVPTKEYCVKQCAQGLWRGTCWALPCHSSKQGARGARRDLPPAAPLCNLLGSGPAVSVVSGQEERPTAAECPHRQDLATSHKILWNHWKEKGGGGKGGLFHLLSAALGPNSLLAAGTEEVAPSPSTGFGYGSTSADNQPSLSTSPTPWKNQEAHRTGTSGKRGWPGRQHPLWRCPSPAAPQDFAGDLHPSQLCRTCQPAQTLPCCSTKTRD